MQHSPGTSAPNPLTQVSQEVANYAVADGILRGGFADDGSIKPGHLNDLIACAQIRVCDDALRRALNAMGDDPATANYQEVADQLERVQECAGRAIVAAVNAQRVMVDPGEGDDADDAVDTMLAPEDVPAQAVAKGGDA